MKKNDNYLPIGFIFQMTLVASFMYRVINFHASSILLINLISLLGMALFSYCLYILYIKKKRDKLLLTSGPFRFTRHPMYTGLLIGDCIYWNSVNFSQNFYYSGAVFILSLIVAGYCQEKETIARFGKPAEDYYAKTPRLFLFYPLRRFFLV